MFYGNAWKTNWKVPEGVTLRSSQTDYRDSLPIRPEDIAEQLAPVVKVSSCDCEGRHKIFEGAIARTLER